MGSFAKVYPCWVCSDGLREWMGREENRINGGGGNSGGKGNTSTNAKPPRVDWLGSRKMFGLWMCRAHNEVNVKLGKKEFDCRRVEERWLKGWEDGRCG